MQVFMRACANILGGQRSALGIILQVLSTLFSEVLLLAPEAWNIAELPA